MRAMLIARGAIACAMLVSAANAQSSTRVIHPGTGLRLRLSDSSEVIGGAVASSDSALVLRTAGGNVSIPRTQIRVADVHHGSWARGGGVGAFIGAFAGLVGVNALASALCDSSSCNTSNGAAVGGMVAGAIPGFLIGSVIGAVRSGWTPESRPISVATAGRPMLVGQSTVLVGVRLERVR